MKATTKTQVRSPRRSGTAARALVPCLLAALVFSTGATAHLGDMGTGGDGNPGFAPGDIIGTLPVYAGGNSPSDAINNPALLGNKAVAQPSFLVYGGQSALEDLVLDATGTGFVTVYAQAGTGMQGLVFHGDVSVSLDRAVLLHQSFATKYWIGPDFGSGAGLVSYAGTPGAGFHVFTNSQLALPLGALAATNVLDDGLLAIDLANRSGDAASLLIGAHHGTIQIDQTIPD